MPSRFPCRYRRRSGIYRMGVVFTGAIGKNWSWMGDRRRWQMEGDSKQGTEQRIVESCVCTANSSAFVFVVNGKAEVAFLDVLHSSSSVNCAYLPGIISALLCTLWSHMHTLWLSVHNLPVKTSPFRNVERYQTIIPYIHSLQPYAHFFEAPSWLQCDRLTSLSMGRCRFLENFLLCNLIINIKPFALQTPVPDSPRPH
jgi:hypothetical protein